MPNTLGKNLHLCFSKLKRPPTTHSPPIPLPPNNHPSPPPPPPPPASTTTTTTSILIKNFNSLFDLTSDSTSKSISRSSDDFSSSESYSDTETIPDFATIFASQRFFFSSPGHSNSIIESHYPPPESDTLVDGGIAIPTYSPDPYMDFRRSMQEMVEAKEALDVRADWDYLHELLLCYLTLNPKHTHKFIFGAFADLLLSLMTPVDAGEADTGQCSVSRWLV